MKTRIPKTPQATLACFTLLLTVTLAFAGVHHYKVRYTLHGLGLRSR